MLERLQWRAETTARCRFVASDRLWIHHRLSQWTVAISSASLLLIPLLQAFGVTLEYTQAQLNVFQVVLAVIVLIFSVLLGLEEYGIRSDRMHRCATEVNELAQRMRPYLDEGLGEYNRFVSVYHNVLQKYNNHSQLDYNIKKLQQKEKYDLSWPKYFRVFAFVAFRSLVEFLHYVILGIVLAYGYSILL